MITISNEHLNASINHKGAELCSLKDNSSKTEYLWQGDPTFWSRHAPILFPIVGRLKNDEYIYEDRTYHLSQHGFARDMDFELIRKEDAYASFSLKSSGQTLMVYPFRFELIVSYELIDSSIRVSYEVYNKDHKDLLFSIGGHPAFNCPIDSGEVRSDYHLHFSSQETVSTQLLTDGIRSGKTIPLLQSQQDLDITDHLFDQDALILNDLSSSMITLMNGQKQHLSMHFENFPYLGIWSKDSQSPFVCLEPWYGVADKESHNQQLYEKEGIIALNVSDFFKCSYVVELH